MRDDKLDSNHDLVLENGDLQPIDDRLEVLQSVKIRLLFIRFEWTFNWLLGVPWMDGMFDIRVPRIQKAEYVKNTIIQTPGVRALTAFEFNLDEQAHGALVGFEAETIYGPITEVIQL